MTEIPSPYDLPTAKERLEKYPSQMRTAEGVILYRDDYGNYAPSAYLAEQARLSWQNYHREQARLRAGWPVAGHDWRDRER